jgi:alginate O-acetyltransferase complex protein AlgI
MVFSSIIFIFLFLPAFLLVYYLLPARFRNLFIVLGGYLFYSWGAPRFAPVLVLSITIDYLLSLLIYKRNRGGKKRQSFYLLLISIFLNLGLLAYFKYGNFIVSQADLVLFFVHLPALPWRQVILPIGISFTVFQELSYSIEVYRGRVKPAHSLIDFVAYLMLFPHVIAGPIVRYIDIAPQLLHREYSVPLFFEGVRRFCLGLAKKVLIANSVSGAADAIIYLNQVRDLSSPLAWLGIILYGIQIYFDFSGYSDMAIGLARMLGFTFLENFHFPYIATSITDFWRRWHISLSTWMREYLYIPLGGNRISSARTYLNLWIVFLASGLWHGAGWNFIVWGAWQGLFIMLDKLFLLKLTARWPRAINIIFTFMVVSVGWAFFRIENFGYALKYIGRLFSFDSLFWPVAVRWTEVLDYRVITALVIGLLISFFPATRLWAKIVARFQSLKSARQTLIAAFYSLVFFLLSIMSLVNSQFNPFIYFRF